LKTRVCAKNSPRLAKTSSLSEAFHMTITGQLHEQRTGPPSSYGCQGPCRGIIPSYSLGSWHPR
jgi:hypothetical protein